MGQKGPLPAERLFPRGSVNQIPSKTEINPHLRVCIEEPLFPRGCSCWDANWRVWQLCSHIRTFSLVSSLVTRQKEPVLNLNDLWLPIRGLQSEKQNLIKITTWQTKIWTVHFQSFCEWKSRQKAPHARLPCDIKASESVSVSECHMKCEEQPKANFIWCGISQILRLPVAMRSAPTLHSNSDNF